MSMTGLWLALSALFGFVALYPFVFYPLSLMAVRRWIDRPVAPMPGRAGETFAVCVCAYNEEGVIRSKIQNMLDLREVMPGLEILVYDDCSADKTAEILREYGDQIKFYPSSQRQGKTHGMNLLVAVAQASVIIFSDANVLLDVKTIPALQNYFADPQVGCVCGHLKYVQGAGATAENGSLYWRLEERIKQLESETGSVMGADGSIFAIRRKLHRPPPDDIIDDMYVSFSILCDGYRIVRAEDVIAYEAPIAALGEEFRRKVRIACQAFNVHRLLWPRLSRLRLFDLYKYMAHKFMRWLVIYWLMLAALCFEFAMMSAGLPVLGLVLIALGCGAVWGGNLLSIAPMPQIADILGAFIGTGVGVWRSVRGDRFQTWAPAASIRQNKQKDAA